jgi:uncharacterized protein
MYTEIRTTVLDQRECWRLLGTVQVGRMGYSELVMPVIRPVPFVLQHADIVVALGASAIRPEAWHRSTIVAFEAGVWQGATLSGWSVHVVGHATPVKLPHAIAELEDLGLIAWLDGEPARYLRISTELMSGRRADPAGSRRSRAPERLNYRKAGELAEA